MSATSAMSIDNTNSLVSIQQLVPKIGSGTSETALENMLLLDLARNNTASQIDASASSVLNSAPYANTDVLINNTTIETPNFVMTSLFTDVSNVLLDSTTINLDVAHSGVAKKFEVLPNSSSYFDSHLKLTVTEENTFYDTNDYDASNSKWEAEFTGVGSNFVKAINSHLNTSTGTLNPMVVKEYKSFNEAHSLGQDMTKYYQINHDYITDTLEYGMPSSVSLNSSNIITNNYMTRITENREHLENSHMGTYKIEQTEDNPIITAVPNTISTAPLYNDKEASHGTTIASDPSGVPSSLTYNQFMQLFDNNETMKILPEYKATFTVESSGGGYKFADSNNDTYFSIDDSNILDSRSYMEQHARLPHMLRLENGSLKVDASGSLGAVNADPSNVGYFSLTTNGEKLRLTGPTNLHLTDGEILLNKDTHDTRIIDSSFVSNNLQGVHVYNIGETPTISGADTLNDADSTSRYVKYDVQNVLKLSGDGANSYGSIYDNSGASMFFVDNGGFIPSPSHVQFTSFIGAVDGEAEIIKIGSNKLLASKDPVRDASDLDLPNVGGYVYARNINLTDVSFSKYHLKMEQKTISDLALLTNNNQVSHNGWTFIMDSTYANNNLSNNDSFLISSSASVNNTNMPVSAQKIVTDNSSVTFSMVYNAVKESITIVHDYVNIFYNDKGVEQVITIPNNQIHKIFDGSGTRVVNPVPVKTVTYNGAVIEIKEVTLTNTYVAKFMLPMQPYDNIVAVTPKLRATTKYYRAYNVTDPSNVVTVPDSVISRISESVAAGSTYDGSYNATMTITTVNPNDEKSCDGLIEARDLKPWKLTLMATDSAGVHPVSDTVDADVFYETATHLELNDSPSELEIDKAAVEADITVFFSLLEIPDVQTVPEVILNSSSYTLNLTNSDGEQKFTVKNLTLNASNMGSSSLTQIASDGHLSPNFDDVTVNGNDYVAKVTYEDLPVPGGSTDGLVSTVVLSIMKNNVAHYRVKITQTNVTDMVIYKNKMDWYRIVKTIGDTASSSTATTTFVQSSYPFGSGAVKVDNGIYIDATNSSVNAGDRAIFRLKNVNISVSTVRTASNTLYELYNPRPFLLDPLNHSKPDASANLNKVDSNGEPLSSVTNATYKDIVTKFAKSGTETLTVNRFRNFYGSTGVNHKYVIDRTASIFRFRNLLANGNVTNQQSFSSVAFNTIYTITNQGLNLKFTPLYSIFPAGTPVDMSLNVTGDPVTINIVNPLQTLSDNYPLTINKTLKDWDLYKYSGGVLDIASRRVKLENSAYTDASYSYTIYLEPRKVILSKSSAYLNDPTTLTYTHVKDFTYYESINDASGVIITGTNSNVVYRFKRDPTVATRASISYLAIIPPFLSFELMTDQNNINHITGLPYSYSDKVGNLLRVYLPVENENNQYNPFNTWFGGVTPTGGTYDPNSTRHGADDVTFKRLSKKALYLYDTAAVTNYDIRVFGNKIKIEQMYGLKDASSPPLLLEHYHGRINKLVDVCNNDTKFISKPSENYIIALRQQLSRFMNINAANTVGNNGVIHNISIAIGNAFMNAGTYKLDLETGEGTNVEFISCSQIVHNSKLALLFEKYSTDAPFDYSNLPLDTLRRISFMITKKETKVVELPAISATDFSNNVPYNLSNTRRALNLSDVNGSWTLDTLDASFNFNFNVVAMSNRGVEKMIELFAVSPQSPYKANYITMKDILEVKSPDGSYVYRVKHNGAVVSTYSSLSATYYNTLPLFDSNQNSDNEYIAYNVNHFANTI